MNDLTTHLSSHREADDTRHVSAWPPLTLNGQAGDAAACVGQGREGSERPLRAKQGRRLDPHAVGADGQPVVGSAEDLGGRGGGMLWQALQL